MRRSQNKSGPLAMMGKPLSLRGAKRRSNPAGEGIHPRSTRSVEPIASLRSQ
ncbi:MAG: hypothetical protein LBT00_13590 [Spirochaetaceae bacterium]|nr:hypothetical protein [Spirochaetaceae bacterium]